MRSAAEMQLLITTTENEAKRRGKGDRNRNPFV